MFVLCLGVTWWWAVAALWENVCRNGRGISGKGDYILHPQRYWRVKTMKNILVVPLVMPIKIKQNNNKKATKKRKKKIQKKHKKPAKKKKQRKPIQKTSQLKITLFFFQERKRVMPEAVIAFITRKVLKALKYLHNNGIAHSEVGTEHIFLSQKGRVKLGHYSVYGPPALSTVCATSCINRLPFCVCFACRPFAKFVMTRIPLGLFMDRRRARFSVQWCACVVRVHECVHVCI